MFTRIIMAFTPALALAALFSGCAIDASFSSEESADTPYCVVHLPSNEKICHSTFRDSIAFATKGRIIDAPEGEASLHNEEFTRRVNDLSAASPLLVTIIAIFYDDRAWGGSRFTVTADFGCDTDPDIDWEMFNFNDFGFNDRATSFESFSDCDTQIFEHAGFAGASFGPFVRISFGGAAMDNRASSARWF